MVKVKSKGKNKYCHLKTADEQGKEDIILITIFTATLHNIRPLSDVRFIFNHNIGLSKMWMRRLNGVDGAEWNRRDKALKKHITKTLFVYFKY